MIVRNKGGAPGRDAWPRDVGVAPEPRRAVACEAASLPDPVSAVDPQPANAVHDDAAQRDEPASMRPAVVRHIALVPSQQVADEVARAKERIERHADRTVTHQRRELLRDMLDVVDDLDRALASSATESSLADGVGLVRDRFLGKLARYGVRRCDDEGMRFDPALHEAAGVVPVQGADRNDTIVAVVNARYEIDGELLRPARVIVGRLG